MDIEFIEEKYREDVFKLMQLCGMDMAEAYNLLTNANYSFERAMQMHFQEEPATNNNSGYQEPQPSSNNSYQEVEVDDFDQLYQRYRVHRQTGGSFEKNYEVRKQSILGGFLPKFFKSSEANFKKLIQNYLNKTVAIKFEASSLSAVLAQSQKFPIIVYSLDFAPASKSKIQQIVRDPTFVDMVNVQFRSFGLDKDYDLEKSLERYVDRKKTNSLIILRVNAVQEIEVVDTIFLVSLTKKQVIQRLKKAKNVCITKELDEGHLERRFNQEMMGNFDYLKPVSIAERRKIAQDREIRRKQEEEFFASMKNQQEKQRKNSENAITHNQGLSPISGTTNKVVQPPKKNYAEERKKIRDRLKTYTTGMNIKLRLPDGESTVLTISMDEKVQYLYDYVFSLEKDIGFERDDDRKFKIMRPYDKLNLNEHLGETLGKVFENSDSETLVVSEQVE